MGLRGMLRRAVWRAVQSSRAAFILAALVSGVAGMLFVAASSSRLDLERSCEEAYARLRFRHFSLPLRGAPDSLVERVRRVPGVAAAEGRHTASVKVPVPAGAAPEQATLLAGDVQSLPCGRRPTVDDVAVDEGRYLSGARGEMLMETRFARAHGFRPGQRLRLDAEGTGREVEIVGLASSPERIWISTSRNDPRPTATTHAVLFAPETDVRDLPSGEDCREIHVRVDDERTVTAVMESAGRSVALWAKGPPVPRDAQASPSALAMNRRVLSTLAATVSPAFALLGSVTLAAALRVLLLAQRRTTGVLLALGCSPQALARPWLEAAALLGGGGGLLGALGGVALGAALTRFYAGVLGLPFVVWRPHPSLWLVATGGLAAVSAAACALTLAGARKQPPAAMLASREAGVTGGSGAAVAITWPVLHRLPLLARLSLLGALRRPARTALMAFGLGFACAQLTLVGALFTSQQGVFDSFFNQVNRWTFYVTLRDLVPASSMPDIATWPGVLRAECGLRLMAQVDVGGHRATVPLLGLPPQADLVRQVGTDGRGIAMTARSGLLLAPAARAALGARAGDLARLTLDDSDHRSPLTIAVGPPLAEPVTLFSRLPLRAAQGVLTAQSGAPSDAVNVVLIRTDAADAPAVRRRLDRWVQVDSVEELGHERTQVERLLALVDASGFATAAFAAALAVVLAVAAGVIGVIERRRELALLAALGLRRGEVERLLVGESLWGWALALPCGIGLGLWGARFVLDVYQNAQVHLTLVTSPGLLAGIALASLLLCVGAMMPCLQALRRAPLREAIESS